MTTSRPLEGILVADLSRVLSGPYCTMILGDMGADVIKIERPGMGDDLRHWGPPFMPDGESTYFLSVNRNKQSITLDLKSEAGRELARRIALQSDVLIENFRFGALEPMGLGYDALHEANPRLVYCSITGFGPSGPLRERPGYDVVAQAMSGLMSVTGESEGAPMRVGVAIVDIVTGLYAAIAILGALRSRERSGAGQKVDVSLLETAIACLPNLTAGYLMAGVRPERLGNGHPNVAPYGVFETKDGHITVAIGNDAQWQRLCAVAGHPESAADPRFTENAQRVARRSQVDQLVGSWLMRRTSDEWVEAFAHAELPSGPVWSVERVLADAQVAALGLIRRMAHPTWGDLSFIGSPMRSSVDDNSPRLPPPLLGEHTEAVLARIGLGSDEVGRFREAGAFGSFSDTPRQVGGDAVRDARTGTNIG